LVAVERLARVGEVDLAGVLDRSGELERSCQASDPFQNAVASCAW
jgi:hypothetical protein